MAIIQFDVCTECPHVEDIRFGTEHVCGHPTIAAMKPYHEDRAVTADRIESFCPLKSPAGR